MPLSILNIIWLSLCYLVTISLTSCSPSRDVRQAENFNNLNLLQNLHFATDLKANCIACRENCGSSNTLNHIKIGLQRQVISCYCEHIAFPTVISWCSINIRILKQVEWIAAVLTIQTTLKLTHGKASNLLLLLTYSFPRYYNHDIAASALLLCFIVRHDALNIGKQNAILIQFNGNSPYLLRVRQSNVQNMKRSGSKIRSVDGATQSQISLKLNYTWSDVPQWYITSGQSAVGQNFSGTYTDWIYTLYIHCFYIRITSCSVLTIKLNSM